MRRKTAALAVGGAVALTAVGGAAVALPTLVGNESGRQVGYHAGTSPGRDGERPDSSVDRQAGRASTVADALAGLVEDGTLTQEQADKVAGALAESAGNGGPGRERGAESGSPARSAESTPSATTTS